MQKSIFTHLAKIFQKTNEFCDIDITPVKRGHLISFCNHSSVSKRIPQMHLHDVPHRKNDEALVRKEVLISRMFFFGLEIFQNSSPADQLQPRIRNLNTLLYKMPFKLL